MSDEEHEKRMRDNAERDESIKGYQLTIANASTNLEKQERDTILLKYRWHPKEENEDAYYKWEPIVYVSLATPLIIGVIFVGLMMIYGLIDKFLFNLYWDFWEYWKEILFVSWLVIGQLWLAHFQKKTAMEFWSRGFNDGATCAYRQLNLAKKNLTKKDFEEELKRVGLQY